MHGRGTGQEGHQSPRYGSIALEQNWVVNCDVAETAILWFEVSLEADEMVRTW